MSFDTVWHQIVNTTVLAASLGARHRSAHRSFTPWSTSWVAFG